MPEMNWNIPLPYVQRANTGKRSNRRRHKNHTRTYASRAQTPKFRNAANSKNRIEETTAKRASHCVNRIRIFDICDNKFPNSNDERAAREC